jgi:hypothetical protein
VPTQCDALTVDASMTADDATSDNVDNIEASVATRIPRKVSLSPRQLSIGDSQASALALAGAAVSLLTTTCQNTVVEHAAVTKTPTTHDSPGKAQLPNCNHAVCGDMTWKQ